MSLFAVLLASLLGSTHCAGMCGGFVAFYSGNSNNSPLPHFYYNFGRLITYIILGTFAGAIGGSVNWGGERIIGIQHIAALLLGVIMVIWGVSALTGYPRLSPSPPADSGYMRKLFKRIFASATSRSPSQQALLIGLASTLLPCGWLYTYAAVAASTANPAMGAAVMAVFWVGTLPMMLSLGQIATSASSPLKRLVPKFAASFLIFAGLYSIGTHLKVDNTPDGESDHCHHEVLENQDQAKPVLE